MYDRSRHPAAILEIHEVTVRILAHFGNHGSWP